MRGKKDNNRGRVFKGSAEDKPPQQYIYAADCYTPQEARSLFEEFKKAFCLDIGPNDTPIKHYVGTKPPSYGGKEVGITVYNNIEYDGLFTDLSVERIRMRAYNVNYMPPIEFFEKCRDKWEPFYKRLMYNYGRKHNVEAARKRIEYSCLKFVIARGVVRSCSTFPISVALSIYKIFSPRRVLDMCSGWGDRMLAAIAYGADRYFGVDPNSELAPQYLAMARLYSDRPHDFTVQCSAFEDMKDEQFDGAPYDLMFSSPPFFMAEHYSEDPNQAHSRYGTNKDEPMQAWLTQFIFKSMDIIWRNLADGGHLIINLNDTIIDEKPVNYTERLIDYIETSLPGARYEGMMRYQVKNGRAGSKVDISESDKIIVYAQPIWVFRKKVSEDSSAVLRSNKWSALCSAGLGNDEEKGTAMEKEAKHIWTRLAPERTKEYTFTKPAPFKTVMAMAEVCSMLDRRFVYESINDGDASLNYLPLFRGALLRSSIN